MWFVMRSPHLEALARAARESFEDRLAARLALAFPESAGQMPRPALRRLIQRGIERADSYGVTQRDAVAGYVERMFTYGPDFDTDRRTAWAGTILRERHRRGDAKMASIAAYEVFVLRRAT